MSDEELTVKEEQLDETSSEEEEHPSAALPFKRAEIYRMLRNNMPSDKIIRSSVKEEMNLFLGRIGKKVANKLGESKYSTIELGDFIKISQPYDDIDIINSERIRIVASLEKIKMDCNMLIMDVNKHFNTESDALGPEKKKIVVNAPAEESEKTEE